MNEDVNRYGPPLLIYSVIFYLSSRPAAGLPNIMPDTIAHFIEYFFMAFFFVRMCCYKSPVDGKAVLTGVPVLLALAFLDELHQYYVPTRHFQLKDIIVDAVGIGVGILVLTLLQKKNTPHLKNNNKGRKNVTGPPIRIRK